MIEVKEIGWQFEDSYTTLADKFFTFTNPNPVKSPDWVMINEDLANELGLNINHLKNVEGLRALSGNQIPRGSKPIAQAYAGHQFGYFTILGDGRAILLGEQITPNKSRFDIQLKGAGKTPYSRGGDGRAALGPMLREYLISEAMYGLGIPTTRALAVVTTGEQVMREQALPGAVLTRVASSHLRVGTFQFARQFGTIQELKQLADYAISRHYPHLTELRNKYILFLKEVIENQAKLVAKWDLVGFVHGVMNTDNMTISGETIDYGPCAFIDQYNPSTVFSSIDQHGRYAYNQQKPVAIWNLARLAESLLPILAEDKSHAINQAQSLLKSFSDVYDHAWTVGMKAKLGFFEVTNVEQSFIEEFLNLMNKFQADYTDTFRALTVNDFSRQKWFKSKEFKHWFSKWEQKIAQQTASKEDITRLMRRSNPMIIPRNYLVEDVLEKAVKDGDYEPFTKLHLALKNPYAYSNEQLAYINLPPESDQRYQTFCGT
ncbi:protein adenylyltransferase SelO [Amphibacillus xylanus]|uniref:Protein nucleotidyltransferase YdiU n=1 Tax=Amphibacillus xylanus (strain ATCC 51415 / DSM 6626 / JCM 7361 / LMG 17667 / NBRC 15112 / Ep01) TaxID=698758 RepID=K0J7K0_AMPXN|nr:YdiU family protein [Amphibacillus xylanus]BAM47503.1 hypothetical protein AXY_13710 [Amphibacillus xylanus NBRC 15112]